MEYKQLKILVTSLYKTKKAPQRDLLNQNHFLNYFAKSYEYRLSNDESSTRYLPLSSLFKL